MSSPGFPTPFPKGEQANPSSFWRKLGGGSLSLSIIVHAIILIIGIFWIFQIIPEKKPDVDFMPKGGGGGQPGAKSETNMKKRATMTTMNAPRLAAKGTSSIFTLPEPDPASAMSSVGALGSTGLSAGLGGSGSGGGKGNGKGKGFGDGMGPGLGGGAGGMSPFGMLNPNANALVGVFYDTKQDQKHKATGMNPQQIVGVIQDFTTRGWNQKTLAAKYYQASRKLYQTKMYIPLMAADAAPKAFECDQEVQPRLWIAIYRGNVSPPKSGKFRFIGASDDALVVRFNRQNVFDHGFVRGTTGLHGIEKGQPPLSYKYSSTPHYNNNIGGFAAGPEFEVRAGTTYPIEILISEVPGGYFGAALMIQESGVEYPKDPAGGPILPLFRLDNGVPEQNKPNAPPFDPQGPVWKLVPSTLMERDI